MQLIDLIGADCPSYKNRSGPANILIRHDDLSIGCIFLQTASGLNTVTNRRIHPDIFALRIRNGRSVV